MFETLKTMLICIKRCIKIIWNYIEIAGLVNLHVSPHLVFRNWVVLVITSVKATCDYRELQMCLKLENGPRHYINIEKKFLMILEI